MAGLSHPFVPKNYMSFSSFVSFVSERINAISSFPPQKKRWTEYLAWYSVQCESTTEEKKMLINSLWQRQFCSSTLL